MKAPWRRHLADRSTSPAPGLAERLGYGVGDTASNLFWKTFEFFLLYFYTDVFGLSPTQVATLFLFTRTLDAISDPLIGMLADRTQSRWGRFRPYLLWVPPALALAISAMFYTPPIGDGGKLVYAYVTYGIVMIAYTAVNTPYGALMAVMTLDTIQRTRLATYRFVLAFVGAIAVQYWTLQWVDRIGHGDDRWGFFVVMTCYGIVSVGLYWVCFATTRERIQAPRPASQNWFADLADLARNRPWMMLFFYSFLTLGAAFVRNSALVYYFKYFCNRGDLIATFLTAGSVAAIVGMILTRVLATRLGKKRLLMAMTLIEAVAIATFALLSPDQTAAMFGVHLIASFAVGPRAVLVWTMYADAADYSHAIHGRRATGLVFSAATFSQKVGASIGSAATGLLLGWYGYVSPVDGVAVAQSPETVAGIRWMVSLIPATLSVLAAVPLMIYPSDQDIQLHASTLTANHN